MADRAERRGPMAWMAGNRVAANLLMLLFIVGGLIMAPRVQQEVFPEVTLDLVTIAVPYPGASPEEVEQGVVLAVEDAVRGLDGIKEVRSIASEGQALVMVQLLTGVDAQAVTSEIESAVGRIASLPADAERPVVSLATNRRQVISLILYGDTDTASLRELAEQARQELLNRPGITLVEVEGLPPPEISIEIPLANLRAHDLSLVEVARRVANASIDLPGGEIETGEGDVLVRTTERRERGEMFEDVAVISEPGGQRVTVGELGRVIDGFAEVDREAYYDGQRAVRLQVYRIGDQTPTQIAEEVRDYERALRSELPAGVSSAIWDDFSEIFRDRIDLLLKNAMLGVILVILILGLFLQPRVAFWVTLGIPVSFLGAFLFMPAADVSINMISLFAFILALGIVVDDAIVVGEAIYRQRQEGKGVLRAAVDGAREVKGPVVFAVLTTIIAFLPMLFVPGVAGKFFRNIPLIVIPVLVISLIESFFVLPAHLGHVRRRQRGPMARVRRVQSRFSDWIERGIDRYYRPLIGAVSRYRWVTLAASVALLVVAAAFVAGGRIAFSFMPRVESDVITAAVRMPVGTPAERTREVMQTLVREIRQVERAYGFAEGTLVRGVYADLGALAQNQEPVDDPTRSGGHLSNVAVALVPGGEREVSAAEISRRWRQQVGTIPGVHTLEFQHGIGPQAGRPIAVELSHDDIPTLRRAAETLAEQLGTYSGVHDVDDGFERGKRQIDLQLTPGARSLGVDETALAREVRAAFWGAEVERQQRGRDELRVYVRLPREERRSVHALETFRIPVPEGGEIPLEQAAYIDTGHAATAIERKDGRRVVEVSAEVEERVVTGGEVLGSLEAQELPELTEQIPGLRWEQAGEQQELDESLAALATGMSIALLAMYVLMAVAFGSYIQPVIVMFAIPFGAVGALAGHLLLGYELSLVSLLGMVALAGVVVNGSLVLVAAINDRRREGLSAGDAVVAGSVRRFRPVLLTSLTTFFGLSPMIFETSVQARFLVPMAISLGFGVLFVTVIALVIAPAAYMAVEDVHRLAARARLRRDAEPEDEAPEDAPSAEPSR